MIELWGVGDRFNLTGAERQRYPDMDSHPIILGVNQSNLHDIRPAQPAGVDGHPGIWQAAQNLAHPDLSTRREGFEYLASLEAARHSPLVAYLLVSRITETDIMLRTQIVQEIISILNPDTTGFLPPDDVRLYLVNALRQMRSRAVFALLQVIEHDPQLYPQVMRLFARCSNAGNLLAEILTDRSVSVELRKLSARLIGDVGYLETKPVLERLAARLGSRQNGNGHHPGENDLLPVIKEALQRMGT